MKTPAGLSGAAASKKIDDRIEELGGWRAETLTRVRKLIHDADPEIQEEWKWMGTLVFSHDGIVCTGESYKEVIKLTFAKGAYLADPKKLFNSSLEGNLRRAIDIREGEKLNESALKDLVHAAIDANQAARAPRASGKKAAAASKSATAKSTPKKSMTKKAAPKKAAPKSVSKKIATKKTAK